MSVVKDSGACHRPLRRAVGARGSRTGTYRELRAVAYRDELGKERGDYTKTIGDVLDGVLGWAKQEIDAGRLNATPEMTTMLATRDAIKLRYPKPLS